MSGVRPIFATLALCSGVFPFYGVAGVVFFGLCSWLAGERAMRRAALGLGLALISTAAYLGWHVYAHAWGIFGGG